MYFKLLTINELNLLLINANSDVEKQVVEHFKMSTLEKETLILVNDEMRVCGVVTTGDYKRFKRDGFIKINYNGKVIIKDNTVLEQIEKIALLYKKIEIIPLVEKEKRLVGAIEIIHENQNEQLLNKEYKFIERMLDCIKWENTSSECEDIQVLNADATVNLLLESPKSFCRFGDGEIELMLGNDLAFQKYNFKLAEILREILEKRHNNLYIGVNYIYFNKIQNIVPFVRKFIMLNRWKYYPFLKYYCNSDNVYIDTGFNQCYQHIQKYDFEKYYLKVKELFKNRKIVVFHGKGILDKLEYSVFELAENIEYVEGPSKDAFDKYEELLEKSLTFSKDKVLCYILGPTSKALVYAANKAGYMAWDIGHLAKDYDSFKRGVKREEENIKKFFAPD